MIVIAALAVATFVAAARADDDSNIHGKVELVSGVVASCVQKEGVQKYISILGKWDLYQSSG
jgi:hypothetical protein